MSGGERQRLVSARAILKKPSILVLDEATSVLDVENQSKVQKALNKIKEKMTIILIVHRLSVIQESDQVMWLNNGSIVEKDDLNIKQTLSY